MPKSRLDELLRKKVEIRSNGLLYRGVLIEVGAHDVTLRRETGFVSIPMDRITSIQDVRSTQSMNKSSFVDQSFYDADLSDDPTTSKNKKE